MAVLRHIQHCFLLTLVLVLPALAADGTAPPTALPTAPREVMVTEALVLDRITEAESAGTDQAALVDAYRAVLEQIRQQSAHATSLAYYESAIEAAGSREAEVRERIDNINPEARKLNDAQLQKLSVEQLDEYIAGVRKDLARWLEVRSSLDRRIAAQPMAGGAIEQRLQEIDARQSELPDTAVIVDKNASPSEYEASQWLVAAERRALVLERKSLSADLNSQPYRFSRRRVEREEAIIWIGILEENLQTALDLKLQQSEDPNTLLLTGFDPATPGFSLLQASINARADLLETRSRLTRQIASAEAYRNLLNNANTRLSENYDSTREIVEAARDNSSFGPLLIRYRRQLDQTEHSIAEQRPDIAIGDLIINNTSHDEQLEQLTNTNAYVDQKIALLPGAPEVSPELREQAVEQARRERALLTEIVRLEDSLLPILRDIQIADTALEQLRDDFASYLQGHILWINSQTPLYQDFSQTLQADLKAVGALIGSVTLSPLRPMVVLGLLAGLALLGSRKKLAQFLDEQSEHVNKPRSDSMGITVKALFATIALALPIALLTLALAEALSLPDVLGARILTTALSIAAGCLLLARFLAWSCTDNGLATLHLDWSPTWTAEARRFAWWTALVFTPLLTAVFLLGEMQNESYDNVLSQLALVTLYSAIGIYLVLALRRVIADEEHKARRYYIVGIVLLAYIVLVQGLVRGYVIAPYVILAPLLQSVAFLLAIILLHTLGVRWLTVTRRRIRFRQLTTSSEEENGNADPEHSYVADLGDLDASAKELLKALGFIVGFVGLYLLWSPLFSGVTTLDEFVLWSSTGMEAGEEVVQNVTLLSLVMALIIALVTYLAAAKLPALLELILQSFSNTSAGSRYAAVTMLNYIIVGAGITAVLSAMGIQWSKLQWLVAALGVGIGFGLQELVANFISGLIIFFERPIRVGDLVTVGESSGTVSRIRIRATTIEDFDRKELLVPNKEFVTGRLLNWSLSDSVNRLTFDVGIAYGSDVGKAMQVLRETVVKHPRVMAEPEPSVLFTLFGDSALNMSVRVYLDSYENRLQVLSDLHEAVDAAFREADIVIAFPQQDVHLNTDGPIKVQMDNT